MILNQYLERRVYKPIIIISFQPNQILNNKTE